MAITRRRDQRRSAKAERFNARLSPEQKELFQRAAALTHQPVSVFILSSAQRAAEETIREHEVTHVSARAWREIMEALRDPGPINPNLVRAAEDYKAFIGER